MGTSINAASISVDTEPLLQSMERASAAMEKTAAKLEELAKSGETAAKGLKQTHEAASSQSQLLEGLAEDVKKLALSYASLEFAKEMFDKVLEAGIELENAQHRLAGVFASTGGAVGFTLEDLTKKAEDLSKHSLFDDKQARNAEAALMSFGTIHGQTFDRALKDSADLASLMGGDVVSSARMLGRALEDPERGLQMLRRSGVAFTEAQRQIIQDLARSGDLFGAQAAILSIVESKVNGLAEAMHTGLQGRLKDLKEAWQDAWEGMSQSSVFQYVVNKVAEFATNIGHALAYMLEGAPEQQQRRAALVAYRDATGQSLDTPQRQAIVAAQAQLANNQIPTANANLPAALSGAIDKTVAKMDEADRGVDAVVTKFKNLGLASFPKAEQEKISAALNNASESVQKALHATKPQDRTAALEAVRQTQLEDVARVKKEFVQQLRDALTEALKYDEGSAQLGWVWNALGPEIKELYSKVQSDKRQNAWFDRGKSGADQLAKDQAALKAAVEKAVGPTGIGASGSMETARADALGYTAGLQNIVDNQDAILNQITEERAKQQISEFGGKILQIETEILQAGLSPKEFNSPEVQRHLDERKRQLILSGIQTQHMSQPQLVAAASERMNEFLGISEQKAALEQTKAITAANRELVNSLQAEVFGYTHTKEELEDFTRAQKTNIDKSVQYSDAQIADFQRLARISRDTYGPLSDLVDQTTQKITELKEGAGAGAIVAAENQAQKLRDEYRKAGLDRAALDKQQAADEKDRGAAQVQAGMGGTVGALGLARLMLINRDLQRIAEERKKIDDLDLRNQLEDNAARVKDIEDTAKRMDEAFKQQKDVITAIKGAGGDEETARGQTIALLEKQIDLTRQNIAQLEKEQLLFPSEETRAKISAAYGELVKLDLELAKTKDRLYDLKVAGRDAFTSGLSTFLDDVIEKTKSVQDAFHAMVKSIEHTIVSAITKAAMKPIEDALNKLLGIKPPDVAMKDASAALAAAGGVVDTAAAHLERAAAALEAAVAGDKSPVATATPAPPTPDLSGLSPASQAAAAGILGIPAPAPAPTTVPAPTVQPVQPVKPAQVVQPVQPVQAVRPVQPVQPIQVQMPVPIAQPVQPPQPVQAPTVQQPVQPAQPVQIQVQAPTITPAVPQPVQAPTTITAPTVQQPVQVQAPTVQPPTMQPVQPPQAVQTPTVPQVPSPLIEQRPESGQPMDEKMPGPDLSKLATLMLPLVLSQTSPQIGAVLAIAKMIADFGKIIGERRPTSVGSGPVGGGVVDTILKSTAKGGPLQDASTSVQVQAGNQLLVAANALIQAASDLAVASGQSSGSSLVGGGIDPFGFIGGAGGSSGGFVDSLGTDQGLLSGGADLGAGVAAASRIPLTSGRLAPTAASNTVHYVSVPIQVSALDGPSAVEALRAHAPVIQSMVVSGLQRNRALSNIVGKQVTL